MALRDNKEYIKNEAFITLQKNVPLNLGALFVVLTVLGVFFWISIASWQILAWIGTCYFIVFVRLLLHLFFKKIGVTNDNLKLWKRLFYSGIILSGLVIGIGGLLIIPGDMVHLNFILITIYGGILVNVVASYAINPVIFYLYSIPLFFPILIRMFMVGLNEYNVVGALGLLYYATMIATNYRVSRIMNGSMELSIENLSLLSTLNQEKLAVEQLNEELKSKNLDLQDLTLRDPLTSLRNRRYFFEVVKPEGDSYARTMACKHLGQDRRKMSDHAYYAVYLVDIDHFKDVNDTYGHDIGDKVLKEFADILQESVRQDDYVIRWGGEEFLIVLRDTKGKYIDEYAQKLVSSVGTHSFKVNNELSIKKTCSIGYTTFPICPEDPSSVNFETLITFIDRALYYAKDTGRNRAVGLRLGDSFTSQTVLEEIASNFEDSLKDGLISFYSTPPFREQ